MFRCTIINLASCLKSMEEIVLCKILKKKFQSDQEEVSVVLGARKVGEPQVETLCTLVVLHLSKPRLTL